MKIEVGKTSKGNIKITIDPQLAAALNSILWDVATPKEIGRSLRQLSDALDAAGVGHDELRFTAKPSFDKNAVFKEPQP